MNINMNLSVSTDKVKLSVKGEKLMSFKRMSDMS